MFKPRCLICAGPHELQERDWKKDNDRLTSEVCCPNCKGKHTANYGGCSSYKMAKKVEQIRVTNKVSYADADPPSPLEKCKIRFLFQREAQCFETYEKQFYDFYDLYI